MSTFGELELMVRDIHGQLYKDADKRMIMFLCDKIDKLERQIDLNKPRHPGSPFKQLRITG